MRVKLGWILMPVLASLVLTVVAAPKDESTTGEILLSEARSHEVWTEGTPAVRMRGQIKVSAPNGKVAQGDYAVDWVSPSQWREEIRFANYQRMRIRDAKGYWQTASLDYQPYLIYLLNNLLDLRTILSVSSKEALGKVKTRHRDGIQKCVDLNMTKGTNRVLCFDDKSGALVSMEYTQGEYENPPELSRIEYNAFHSVAGKLIPYERRGLKDGKTIASVKIAEVNELNSVNAAEFTPPASAELWPQCDGMREADLLGRVAPNYPEAARHNLESGKVILYGVVEADGALSHMVVIKGASPALNEAAVASFRDSHYTPAQCQATPIRLEKFFETDFHLRQ